MAGVLQRNPQWKTYMSDAKNNIEPGAGVTSRDSGSITVTSGPGKVATTSTSGFQQQGAKILSDRTAGAVGNTVTSNSPPVSPNTFQAMGVSNISVAAGVGGNPPIATFTLTPLFGQVPQIGAQMSLNGATSALGLLLNKAVYRTLEVLTSSASQFTAFCPGITPSAGGAETTGNVTYSMQGRLAGASAMLGN